MRFEGKNGDHWRAAVLVTLAMASVCEVSNRPVVLSNFKLVSSEDCRSNRPVVLSNCNLVSNED